MTESAEKTSYDQILTSTAVVGGSQVINILLGIVRTKFLAVLLGPAGIGLMGMYLSVTNMVGSVAGLGIGYSGVRQISVDVGLDNREKVARTVLTLRRASNFLGVAGSLLTLSLCVPLSRLTFGNEDHWREIAVLSVIIFFGAVSGGQGALIQGMRRIGDLASLSILGAFLGMVLSIPMVYFWGEGGIVPFLVTVSVTTFLTSWWYARRVSLADVRLSWMETWAEARGLISLGLAFMSSSLMAGGVLYLIRILLVRKIGLDGVGLYQAAFTLSTLYIGVILSAMGMDFYPRLASVAENNEACNRMVNEQTEVGLLVAAPGILATLVFAPYVIEVFYSARFIPAYDVLRWQILGVFLRVVCWPMVLVPHAKGNGRVFFLTELTASIVHVALIWGGVSLFGLEGTGIAFFALYVFYTAMMLAVVHRLSLFRWSDTNLRMGLAISVCVASVFLLPRFATRVVSLAVGSVVTLVVTLYCGRNLYLLVGPEWIAGFRSKMKTRLGRMKNG